MLLNKNGPPREAIARSANSFPLRRACLTIAHGSLETNFPSVEKFCKFLEWNENIIFLSFVTGFCPFEDFSQLKASEKVTYVWEHALILLWSHLLPGAYRQQRAAHHHGFERCGQFPKCHRVLSRAVWDSRPASRLLLKLLLSPFAARRAGDCGHIRHY